MKNNIAVNPEYIPAEFVAQKIYLIRGQKVMLDFDLAKLYQVSTKVLNQAVRRNLDRFPEDFMMQLTDREASSLRSQFVTLEKGRGRYSKYNPYAFTEHGVAMLSSVLHSKRAVQMNILIIRVFMKMRELLVSNKELADRVEKLEISKELHQEVLTDLIKDIKELKSPPPEPEEPKEPIGFR